MALVGYDFYATNDYTARTAVGTIADGLDSTYGKPAKFMYVKHVNAVTVVSGHCAGYVSRSAFTVTNDVSGGADGSALVGCAAGAYINVPTQGYYCWIQIEGYHATLLGDGSVGVGEGIAWEATDGTWDTATTGDSPCGLCLLADTGSPATFPGILKVAH